MYFFNSILYFLLRFIIFPVLDLLVRSKLNKVVNSPNLLHQFASSNDSSIESFLTELSSDVMRDVKRDELKLTLPTPRLLK